MYLSATLVTIAAMLPRHFSIELSSIDKFRSNTAVILTKVDENHMEPLTSVFSIEIRVKALL